MIYVRAATLLIPIAVAIGALWLLSGTARISTGAGEPLVSPLSPQGARDLRNIALESVAATGDLIVAHPDLEEDLVWPFRDSGTILIATRIPPAAGFVLWPVDAPAPAGFRPIEADWALTRTIRAPTADTLEYRHWLLDRNTLASRPDRIAVYTRAEP
jgi:hypothetical protein